MIHSEHLFKFPYTYQYETMLRKLLQQHNFNFTISGEGIHFATHVELLRFQAIITDDTATVAQGGNAVAA